jgi:hypothetical protein
MPAQKAADDALDRLLIVPHQVIEGALVALLEFPYKL